MINVKPISSSRELEQLAVRIHKLIERTGASVTWNRHVTDPDTGSSRQIDGVIKRDGKTIHIECRDYKNPQSVMWIEELIGRRESLQADSIIAVSLSGFSQPALAKAKVKGIVTRTLTEMTDAEIVNWGKSAQLVANYLEVSELELKVFIPIAELGFVTDQPKLWLSGSSLSPEYLILQELTQRIGDDFHFDRSTTISANLRLPTLMIDGSAVVECEVKVRGHLRQDTQDVLGIWNYRGFDPVADTEAVVSKHGPGLTEIIQNNDKATLMLDMSSINTPENCFPLNHQVDFGRNVNIHIATVGAPIRIDTTFDTKLIVKTVLS